MVASMIPYTRDRYVDLLVSNPGLEADRQAHADRFLSIPGSDIAGSSVLLFDDTWTTGAHAQSAAWALKRAGAARVAILVIGRHFVPSFAENNKNLRLAKLRRFSWDHCCIHGNLAW
jgi:phosphoribosylpyrophosphate synthetase